LVQLLNEKLKLFLYISFGIFLFILFFQPFPLIRFDFNNRLIFVAGFGAITFLFMFIHGLSVSRINNPLVQNGDGHDLLIILSGFLLLSLSSVSFAFYLRYVGSVSITFHIMAKIIFICFVPPVLIQWYDSSSRIKHMVEALILEKKLIQNRIEKYEDDLLNQYIEFNSESNTEPFNLKVSEIAFVRSADNYVEIVYRENDGLKKRLIRNTLKNIELQLKVYSNFVRCHRICIVNMHLKGFVVICIGRNFCRTKP